MSLPTSWCSTAPGMTGEDQASCGVGVRMSLEQGAARWSRMCAEHWLVPSPHTQICIHKRVVQHFAEMDTTSLLCLFLQRLKSPWDRGLAAQVSAWCVLHLRCSFQLSLVLLCVSRRSGPCSEWKPFPWLHPAAIALLLGEGSCLLQVLCSCPPTAELSLGHPSNPRLGCSFSRALSWYLWWFGTCCSGRWGGSASVRTVLFVY